MKGAPNIVLGLCVKQLNTSNDVASVKALNQSDRDKIFEAIDGFSSQALRVLAVAYRPFKSLPDNADAETLERDLVFVGLVASIDPERDEVIPAIDNGSEVPGEVLPPGGSLDNMLPSQTKINFSNAGLSGGCQVLG